MIDWHPIETAPRLKMILLFAPTEYDVGSDVFRNWKMQTGYQAYRNGVLKLSWSVDFEPKYWAHVEPPKDWDSPNCGRIAVMDDMETCQN